MDDGVSSDSSEDSGFLLHSHNNKSKKTTVNEQSKREKENQRASNRSNLRFIINISEQQLLKRVIQKYYG